MYISEEYAKKLLKLKHDLEIAAAFTNTMILQAIEEGSDCGTNLTLTEALDIQAGIDRERLVFQQITVAMDDILKKLNEVSLKVAPVSQE